MPPTPQSEMDARLARLPELLRPEVAGYWRDFARHAEGIADSPVADKDWRATLPSVWACSEFVARACIQHPAVLRDLVASGDLFHAYAAGDVARRVHGACAQAADEAGLKRVLREVRRREMLRVAWRDLAGWADLAEVMETVSELAAACIAGALTRLHAWASARHGEPRVAGGDAPAHMVVLAMGKLGGGELNFSSDIDLIFAYTEDGEASGGGLSNHEYFTRLGRGLINALNEPTEDGIVFRVDMRLRPNGASGPLVLPFEAMEIYYQTHGRAWERYAFIKARIVAGDHAAGAQLLAALKPFVYRKYLDYGAIDEIRTLKASIHRELMRKGIRDNIKLGPGGIREIEFIGQAFQLVRGGRLPALQERAIQPVLATLAEEDLITAQTARELAVAYVFLRNTEHRLQMVHDRQTQTLPHEPLERLRLAVSLGFSDWESFHACLERHRRKVQEHFEQVFVAPQGEAPAAETQGLLAVWHDTLDAADARQVLGAAGYAEPGAALDLLRALRRGGAYSALSSYGRERLDRLMPLLIAAVGIGAEPQVTLTRLVKLIEAIGRRSVYLALLVENPLALSQLVKLCGASAWIADWIAQHPILLDELIDPVSLYAPMSRAALGEELAGRLSQLPPDDLEAQMEALREFRHGHVLRVAAADVGPGLAPEEVGRHLGHIAEAVLEQALALATADLEHKHGRATCAGKAGVSYPGFAVIAYGKLGSLELGYTSDLDMIFLHDACDGEGVTDGARPVANEVFYARLGQRLIHILTARTPAGILYEVDMRLRPSGASGPLVTNPAAFESYQREHAWAWEHQALVRARPVAGCAALAATFERLRCELLCLERDPDRLRAEVRDMRARMRAARPARDPALYDLKQDPGGMIDIEFMVQYCVLRWAHAHPDLTRYRDNISILEALAGAGLLEAGRAKLLIDAYRHYLSAEQRLKLMERRPLLEPRELDAYPEKVAAAWGAVLE